MNASAQNEMERLVRVNREQQTLLNQVYQYVDEQGLAKLGQSRVKALIEAHKRADKERKMSNHKMVPMEPTPEMVEAAEDAYMPFGDMDLAIRVAVLAAPDVQGELVATLLIGEPERTERGLELGDWDIAPNATAIEAFARLAGPGAYQLYLAPQPAEQKPATDVAGLVEALELARDRIESERRSGEWDPLLRDIGEALAAHRGESSHDNQ